VVTWLYVTIRQQYRINLSYHQVCLSYLVLSESWIPGTVMPTNAVRNSNDDSIEMITIQTNICRTIPKPIVKGTNQLCWKRGWW
jgi:hypothetical protein